MRKTGIVVLGAGPAGLSAAVEATRAGAPVTLIDQYAHLGGQYFKSLPDGFQGNARPDWVEEETEGKALLQETSSGRVQVLTNATVFDLSKDKILSVARQDHFFRLQAEKIIFATGAYERPVPFPGWTLPGVLTAGAVQVLVKIQRVLPGQHILVVGSGPMLFPTASMLVDAGAQVVALVQAARLTSGWRQILNLANDWQTLWRGTRYMWNLQRAGTPLLMGHTLLRVEGKERAERAIVAEVNADWYPKAGTERDFAVDAVCVSFGFLPCIEPARLAGCDVLFDRKLSGWVLAHGQDMETSVPGVFVAGETAGIGGAKIAIQQGKIAGINAARQLGCQGDASLETRLDAAHKALARLQRFHKAMDEVYELRPGIWSLMRDDTIVCRCNEVTKAKLVEEAIESSSHIRELRLRTFAGLGACQSRFCGDVALRILAETKGVPMDQVTLPRIRPPVSTVPIAALAQEIE